MRPAIRQIGPALLSIAAIASCPELTVPSGRTHCRAAAASSSLTPSSARSANCQATTSASGPILLSTRCTQLVQKAQSPSKRSTGRFLSATGLLEQPLDGEPQPLCSRPFSVRRRDEIAADEERVG